VSIVERNNADEVWAELGERPELKAKNTRKLNPKPQYKRFCVPTKDGATPFVIVPEISPHLARLVELAGKEAGLEDREDESTGIYILGARVALILNQKPDSVVRRLYSVLHHRQLFINATFVEACLMAMDAEHEVQYGEWPCTRAAALERVSIEAEMAGKKLSPTKLLGRANRLYEKGVRKAYGRVCEVTP
jgi:hypothetical protein